MAVMSPVKAILIKWIDPRIFRETQVKSFLRWLTSTPPLLRIFFTWFFIKKIEIKLAYFDQGEDKNSEQNYKLGEQHHITAESADNFTIHNLGHATQLIQTSGMNILTDPVFHDFAPIVYPSMTKRFRLDIHPDELPQIDVILISHNHRDHVDETSLRKLIKKTAADNQPQLLVPQGDEEYFRSLGFTNVSAFEWHEQITLTSKTNRKVTFCSTPADHRSGRKGYDSHKSLVMGWTISPKNQKEILYFAGDTAKISDVRMKSLALDIYHLYQHKHDNVLKSFELPKIINMEPGGPNYTRKDMQPTHQSAVDSIISALAVSLEEVNQKDQRLTNKITAEKWLEATATIFMHQNKYELGPDRFNENVFVFNRLLSYLQMDDEILTMHEEKQKRKSTTWSLFHRRKDFIITGVKELKDLAQILWPDESPAHQKTKIVEFIQARTHFPLIRQKLSSGEVFQFNLGEVSTIIPDTKIPGIEKRKGEKDNQALRL